MSQNTGDEKWVQVTKNELRVTMSDYEWQKMTTSDNG